MNSRFCILCPWFVFIVVCFCSFSTNSKIFCGWTICAYMNIFFITRGLLRELVIFCWISSHTALGNQKIANDEQYHQKLKYSCNFDKKQRSKTIFLSIKLYTHARSYFKPYVSQIYSFIDKKTFSIFAFCENCNYV